ncbi:MAG TPA: Nif3-like dinuclear metal center hexameric protein [Burkholderiales bacterium]|nr:Nif3-like dinuclear metal center hexameric protein [Burkholderiales bacterium]
MLRDELARYLDQLLDASRIKDYCPNGLQVEGRAEVAALVTGVTGSAALIEAATAAGADALLVHHGYFWRGEDPRLVGARKRRIELLLAAGINLFAYHLPLDLHPELGNNAQLAARLGLVSEGRTGEQDLVSFGAAPAGDLAAFAAHVEARLGRAPLVVGDPGRAVRRIAWCTGGAQGFFETAVGLGVDAYLTGEISEQHVHLARESGVAFVAAGHHATERFGVQAVGEHLAQAFGLRHRFIDVPNPV